MNFSVFGDETANQCKLFLLNKKKINFGKNMTNESKKIRKRN